jgi:succinyl-CoA synthetase alpha subunit
VAQVTRAAETIARLRPAKPIVALVAGRYAPARRRMGHAGALAMLDGETAAAKIAALEAAGVTIAPDAASVGETMRRALRGERPLRRAG